MEVEVPSRIYDSQLRLLRYCSRSGGCVVDDVQTWAGTSRQAAYKRLELLVAQGWLEYTWEPSPTGTRQRARYYCNETGRAVIKASWKPRRKLLWVRA